MTAMPMPPPSADRSPAEPLPADTLPADTLDDLERALAFLGRIQEASQRKRGYPLERALYLLLGRIVEGEGLTISHLAQALLLDESTVTRQVATLGQAGLVEKRPNPADRRSLLVAATATGRDQHTAMRALRLERIGLLFAPWSESDREVFRHLLGRYIDDATARINDPTI
ncbi:MarR family winged helix-turn-helix transcriptional regulator [Rhodospirillum rubrum]|uniref:Transcriptional regulator, MarR family n=1 Tax=Rhodospirillum rubrum (strain ATCC 11170 / ATH 1.1.1 / DSM 467 / LMG 4362 / NCIMB 8255 / S1) TaxID=269796 RepID=Q2RQK8_RHORT|nr:MarR family transcriptional regulator [Rhodospirillum rubrum]ABC23587.1 transcriptional regulator, MarR family [Rhodospirillum rubrum ATCC 11170]AEO49325.1 MarR family transcriptional regulator [Rhodospirillum rubrum F11]MBK5955262.1 MarR family transcriptional regulator [Rhodospirillum rubrum]QXG79549.1 MarR family transcriptional regulator [Rhodospirillum rubrum]HAP98652.1 MarR family transcriptional regulator [Rhodospirillum rubrum]